MCKGLKKKLHLFPRPLVTKLISQKNNSLIKPISLCPCVGKWPLWKPLLPGASDLYAHLTSLFAQLWFLGTPSVVVS